MAWCIDDKSEPNKSTGLVIMAGQPTPPLTYPTEKNKAFGEGRLYEPPDLVWPALNIEQWN